MSIVAGAAGDYLLRTANVPAPVPFSWCAWIYGITDDAGVQHFMNIDDGTDQGVEFQFSATTLRVWDGRGQIYSFGSSPTRTGEWVFVALRSNGTGGLLARWATKNSPTFTTLTTGVSGAFAGSTYQYSVLGPFDGSNAFLGRMDHVRLWDAELTDNELYLEMFSALPVRLTNLNCAYRVISASSVTDIGPNGRNATVNGGSMTLAEDPPIDDSMIWSPQFAQMKGVIVTPGTQWLRSNAGMILRGDPGRYLKAA